jgi:hypothetical protein
LASKGSISDDELTIVVMKGWIAPTVYSQRYGQFSVKDIASEPRHGLDSEKELSTLMMAKLTLKTHRQLAQGYIRVNSVNNLKFGLLHHEI